MSVLESERERERDETMAKMPLTDKKMPIDILIAHGYSRWMKAQFLSHGG